MLVDSAHSEETRVVVVRGNRIEEFDYESAQRKQLKGNIYLAKVTRVEPSLQAAFVDYGGNRHGFLAFSEIHPDYYQIPVADRQALLREEADEARRNDEDYSPSDHGNGDADDGEEPERGGNGHEHRASDDDAGEADAGDRGEESNGDGETSSASDREDDEAPATPVREGVEAVEETVESTTVESVGVEDAMEEVPQRRRPLRRTYKIQEVIKRRQVLLVQVVKEERGNKGAALTTYLSLAGRYCVLMPNTARGGGISRKITDSNDRRRLKEVARDIEVPEGMGLIVRTAGAQRTKAEIKRDFDYLIRLWENVRDLTLQSTAPSLVYEEGSLIKRSIRDLYTKDVDEILVEGDDGYREAKDFMKMLMPSHARNVKLYKDTRPLFSRYQMESQLDALFSPTVTLPSGGYLVINQTEALVSIDINSGKSTREHNIEDTALRTNLEASDEIARQLRLRDLAGLIVIDFIDMEEPRNNRAVERRLKEALKNDRARIQVGRISHFGLLEMSRQRLRQGMLEGSTKPCPHCEGRGIIRSVSSCALSVLRGVEDHLISRRAENLTVKCHPDVAVYILNEKRDNLLTLELTYGISVFIVPSGELRSVESVIERAGERQASVRRLQQIPVRMDTAGPIEEVEEEEIPAEEEAAEDGDEEAAPREDREGRSEHRGRDRGDRRERGDGERGDRPDRGPRAETAEEGEERRRRRRRRRGRRGGRRNREDGDFTPRPVEDTEEAMLSLGEPDDFVGEPAESPAEEDAPVADVEDMDEPAPETINGEAVIASEGDVEAEEREPRRRTRGGRGRGRGRAERSESADGAPREESARSEEPRPRGRRSRARSEEAPAEPVAAEAPEAQPVEAPAPRAAAAKPAPAPAAPAAVEPEPQPESVRRWTPPQQTAPTTTQPKAGWWRR
ncbi:MAG: Rne/Rng family ribonuclease [Hyphomicrobiales bacterium]